MTFGLLLGAALGASLCLLVFALTFPGRNRFNDHPASAFVDVVSSWLVLLGILARRGHALAAGWDADALRRYPWILPPEGTPLRQLWQAMFAELGGDGVGIVGHRIFDVVAGARSDLGPGRQGGEAERGGEHGDRDAGALSSLA